MSRRVNWSLPDRVMLTGWAVERASEDPAWIQKQLFRLYGTLTVTLPCNLHLIANGMQFINPHPELAVC